MVEDVELTKEILGIYADEDCFPSSIHPNEICLKLQNTHGRSKVILHLVYAKDSGLLLGEVYQRQWTTTSTQYSPRRVDGLSKEGSDYIKYARSGLWERAISHVNERSIPLTTQILAKVFPVLAEKAIS